MNVRVIFGRHMRYGTVAHRMVYTVSTIVVHCNFIEVGCQVR